MPRRRKQDDSGFIIALATIAVAACVAFFFVIPVLVILWWICAEAIGLTQRKYTKVSDVGPSPLEAARCSSLDAEVAAREALIDAKHREGEGLGLRRRVDGLFDQRAYAGRELNLLIEAEERGRENAIQIRADLAEAVEARIGRWATRRALATGGRAGAVTFLVATFSVPRIDPELAEWIGNLNFLVGQVDARTKLLLGTLAIAGALASIVNLCLYSWKRRALLP